MIPRDDRPIWAIRRHVNGLSELLGTVRARSEAEAKRKGIREFRVPRHERGFIHAFRQGGTSNASR